MKSKAARMLVAALVIVIVCVCICGCEEQSLTPDTKKARLVASENIELKKQLEECRKDLAEEKELRQKDAQEAKVRAEKYEEQIKRLQGPFFLFASTFQRPSPQQYPKEKNGKDRCSR